MKAREKREKRDGRDSQDSHFDSFAPVSHFSQVPLVSRGSILRT